MYKRFFIPGAVFALAALVCAAIALRIYTDNGRVRGGPDISGTSSLATDDKTPYKSPVDFASLCKKNEDVCGWLTIKGTDISYPVLQHKTDDAYYLKHSIDGIRSINGALFTEKTYNSTDFNDPVTAIYGHDMKSGAMFGLLQEQYADAALFKEHKEIIVYCPEKELHYEVFAAVAYSKLHILHYYDSFKEKQTVDEFISEIYNIRDFRAITDSTAKPTSEDKLLILSTCLKGDLSRRFLVVARLKSQIN